MTDKKKKPKLRKKKSRGRPLKPTKNCVGRVSPNEYSEEPVAIDIKLHDSSWVVRPREPKVRPVLPKLTKNREPLKQLQRVELTEEEMARSMTTQEITAARETGFEITFENTMLDMSREYNITVKQANMVRYFLTTARFDMKRAMVMAGYSKEYARQHHVDMLQNLKIVKAVQTEMLKTNSMPGASRFWLQKELRNILKLSMEDRNYVAALKAVEMLGRSIGELGSQVKHSHEGGTTNQNVSYIVVANKKIPIN